MAVQKYERVIPTDMSKNALLPQLQRSTLKNPHYRLPGTSLVILSFHLFSRFLSIYLVPSVGFTIIPEPSVSGKNVYVNIKLHVTCKSADPIHNSPVSVNIAKYS